MAKVWGPVLAVALICAACSSDGGDGHQSGSMAGKGGGGTGGSTAGSSNGGSTVDPNTCAICDVAARCCFAAVGQDYCSAYSTAECLKKADPAETIDYCRIEVDAASSTPGCN
jgi:hypothetical protein